MRCSNAAVCVCDYNRHWRQLSTELGFGGGAGEALPTADVVMVRLRDQAQLELQVGACAMLLRNGMALSWHGTPHFHGAGSVASEYGALLKRTRQPPPTPRTSPSRAQPNLAQPKSIPTISSQSNPCS